LLVKQFWLCAGLAGQNPANLVPADALFTVKAEKLSEVAAIAAEDLCWFGQTRLASKVVVSSVLLFRVQAQIHA
jgi:hypothetical protein